MPETIPCVFSTELLAIIVFSYSRKLGRRFSVWIGVALHQGTPLVPRRLPPRIPPYEIELGDSLAGRLDPDSGQLQKVVPPFFRDVVRGYERKLIAQDSPMGRLLAVVAGTHLASERPRRGLGPVEDRPDGLGMVALFAFIGQRGFPGEKAGVAGRRFLQNEG